MNELKLYNTLTRQKEIFRPIDPAHVRMYVCGPTVYDFAHIGNARPVIVFDVLYRLLKHLAKQGVWDGGRGETQVIYTRNITDVDDKINDRAARDFPGLPLNEAIRRVTESTNNQFQADVTALGCLAPDHQPRATEHIDDMVAIVAKLLAKGFAYVAEGSEGKEVLFSVASMPRYGQLSNRKLEDQEAGARVAVEAHKRNPGDFVLWKQSSADQPGWHASFEGVAIYGRPGWHIECSAMSMAKLLEPFGGGLACDDPLKNTFDIHGGGIDLVFPHHENEIAQSCCAFGAEKMANIWMHNGFLQVKGQKMSKSLGNFVTINELLATEKFGGRSWPGEVLRLAMLMTNYRQPIDFSIERLREAEAVLEKWADMLIVIDPLMDLGSSRPDPEFVTLLRDDLNTNAAIVRLHQIAREMQGRDLRANAKKMVFRASLDLLGLSGSAVLGSKGATYLASLEVPNRDEITALVNARLAAREAKNWAEADSLRQQIEAMGIQLKDGKDASGKPTTTWEVKR